MRLIVTGSRTITDHGFGLLVLTVAALSALSTPATAQPTSIADTATNSVEEGLRYALRGEVPHILGTQFILRAGATDNRPLAPLLREIVVHPATLRPGAERTFETHTAAALHVLWLQGEDPAYFEGMLRAWPDDYMLAYQAAIVLARTPTPEVLALLDEVHEASRGRMRNDYIGGVLTQARQAAYYIRLFEALPTLEARARMVAETVTAGWSTVSDAPRLERLSQSGWVDIRFTDPYSAVTWGWFLDMSREDPAAVADAIVSVVEGRRERSEPSEFEAYWQWVRGIAPGAVRELLPAQIGLAD